MLVDPGGVELQMFIWISSRAYGSAGFETIDDAEAAQAMGGRSRVGERKAVFLFFLLLEIGVQQREMVKEEGRDF